MSLKKALLIVILASFMPIRSALAQPNGLYTTDQAHSHHDYEQSIPFWQAYHQQFGSIEVDVHARNGVLYVAHDETGINSGHITELANFLNSRPTAEYRNKTVHAVYQPTYRQNDALSPVKNVILLIGDGMGLAQIYAGMTANQGQLNLTQVLNLGFSKTNAADTFS